MYSKERSNSLIIPIYINEKIVLDMLAILEDGFSMVSQVSYSEHKENQTDLKGGIEGGTSATILSKLLKIDLSGDATHTESSETNSNISKEKIHTNTSLLSMFRDYLTLD